MPQVDGILWVLLLSKLMVVVKYEGGDAGNCIADGD
jgi:hypothetical protein